MDCCGRACTRRHWMRSTLLASAGAMLAGCAGPPGNTPAAAASDAPSAAALKLLEDNVSVDVHSHGGATGVTSRNPASDHLARGMRAGRIAIVCLADVPDGPILGRNANNVLAAVRQPQPGQLYQYHLDRLAWMDELVARHGIRRALSVADLRAAHYVDGLKEMADIVGVEHVSIGTDQLATTGVFPEYDQFTRLVDAMLLGGFTPADAVKVIGGNYLRIFAASVG